jgi:hypothetical protein
MATTLQNIGDAFGYVFKDGRWLNKIALGALFMILAMMVVGLPFILGYMLWITRNVIRREPYPLPEWTHLGEMYLDGLKLMLVYLVYYIPFFIIIVVPLILFFVLGFIQWQPGFIAAFFSYYVFMILASLAYGLFLMPIYVRFAVTGDIAKTLAVGKVWRFFSKNFVNLLLLLALGWVAGIIGGLGVVALGVGVLFTMMYAYMIQAHLLGQLELAAQQDGNGIMAGDQVENLKE